MSTKTKKGPKTSKEAVQPQKKEVTAESLTEIIEKTFKGIGDKTDARYLWTDNGGHRFRVNCWVNRKIDQNPTIKHSEFVRVIEKNGKLTVRRSS